MYIVYIVISLNFVEVFVKCFISCLFEFIYLLLLKTSRRDNNGCNVHVIRYILSVKFCFLASVKKSGQMLGVKGGIYLDELNHDEPELTALYLYSRKTYVIFHTS